jgi:hypothetical protein
VEADVLIGPGFQRPIITPDKSNVPGVIWPGIHHSLGSRAAGLEQAIPIRLFSVLESLRRSGRSVLVLEHASGPRPGRGAVRLIRFGCVDPSDANGFLNAAPSSTVTVSRSLTSTTVPRSVGMS